MSPKRVGLPKSDRTNPGGRLYIDRQSQPEAFRTPEEQAAANAEVAAATARLAGLAITATQESPESNRPEADSGENNIHGSDDEYVPGTSAEAPRPKRRVSTRQNPPTEPASEVEAVVDREEADPEEEDDHDAVSEDDIEDEDGDADESADDAAVDALAVNSAGWVVGQPKAQPLAYAVVADGHGGVKYMTIQFAVDFSSRRSVRRANHRRQVAIWRANKRHGQPVKRPATKGREYSQANDDWLTAAHHSYAGLNNGKRIPYAELTDQYNTRFPTENRTRPSISSHLAHKPELKAMRQSYPE